MGLKLYFSAGMASAAATMFLLKRGSWAFTAALTGLATGERFGDAEVPPADCWAGAPAATAMAATANHASLFQIISVLLPAFFLPLPESILSRSAANNLAAARVRQTNRADKQFGQPARSRAAAARNDSTKKSPSAGLVVVLFLFFLLSLLLRALLLVVLLLGVLRIRRAGNTKEGCERQST